MPDINSTMTALLQGVELTDYVRSAALIISFLLVAFWDRKVWMMADLICSFGFGLAFLVYPSALLTFQVDGHLDKVLLSLARLFGAALLSHCVIWWQTRETRDGTVTITLMLSRIFSCSALLISMGYCQFFTKGKTKPYWNDQHIYFGMLGCGLWFLGHLIHFLRSHDFSTYPQNNIPLNTHLRIDSWFTILDSLCLLMFPEILINFTSASFQPTAIHLHFARAVGVIGFGSGIISLQAPGFLHERDKRSQLMTRIASLVLFVVTIALNRYWYNLYALRYVKWFAPCMAVVFLNSLFGCIFNRQPSYKMKQK